MEVCAEEKAEEADAKCRQCKLGEKMENVMAVHSGLITRISELENALATEREKTKAMGERLRSAEEGLSKVVKGNKEDAGEGGSSTATTPVEGRRREHQT